MKSKALLHVSLLLLFSYQYLSSSLIFSGFNGNKEQLGKYSIIIDSHIDTLTKIIDLETWLPTIDIGETTNYEVDIQKKVIFMCHFWLHIHLDFIINCWH